MTRKRVVCLQGGGQAGAGPRAAAYVSEGGRKTGAAGVGRQRVVCLRRVGRRDGSEAEKWECATAGIGTAGTAQATRHTGQPSHAGRHACRRGSRRTVCTKQGWGCAGCARRPPPCQQGRSGCCLPAGAAWWRWRCGPALQSQSAGRGQAGREGQVGSEQAPGEAMGRAMCVCVCVGGGDSVQGVMAWKRLGT